jgi:hypothetical protein
VYCDEQLAASHGPRINRDTGQPGQGVDASGRRNTQSASHFFNRPPHSVLKGLGLTGLGSPLDQRPLLAKSTFPAAHHKLRDSLFTASAPARGLSTTVHGKPQAFLASGESRHSP